jgi:hypothetical protein
MGLSTNLMLLLLSILKLILTPFRVSDYALQYYVNWLSGTEVADGILC